jgi:uncharacterized protein (DUF1810 family)
MQSLANIKSEATISKRLWIKVLGMLQQNWCILEPGPMGNVDLVFFDDRGKVFDWLTVRDLSSAQIALDANGFTWMWRYSSFYRVGGMPRLPKSGNRQCIDPIYSSGEYWDALSKQELSFPLRSVSIQTSIPDDDLDRFVEAQNMYWYSIVEELAAGRKQTHWMWFVFPQLRGIGSSHFSRYFGLESPREAAKFWDDDVLGCRLQSCVQVLLGLPRSTSIAQVFGDIDAMKLRSCMTLFEHVSYQDESITEVLNRFFSAERCSVTLDLIKNSEPARRMRISR